MAQIQQTLELNRKDLVAFFDARLKRLAPLATTQTASGHILDWIRPDRQVPGGVLALPPPPLGAAPRTPGADTPALAELAHPGAVRGPAGTVPVRRPNVAQMDFSQSLKARQQIKRGPPVADAPALDYKGHYYGNSSEAVTCYGGQGDFSCFVPAVSSPGHFSLIQIGVSNSQQGYFQTVEAGWQVFPNLFGSDDEPHLFTYFTTNGYTSEGDDAGGYNTDHTGWVQYDANYYPGMTFSPRSVIDGDQRRISIKYQLYQGNWWLNVQGVWMGYYPASMYAKVPPGATKATLVNTLGDHADRLGFWGEVYDPDNTPPSTQMGSGLYANAGWGWSAYMHSLLTQTDAAGTLKPYTTTAFTGTGNLYTFAPGFGDTGALGSHAFVGGPGAFALPAAAHSACHAQVGLVQTDVFAIDLSGGLGVNWVDGAGGWQGGGPIGGAGRFAPGAPIAALQQIGLDQTDVFAVDMTGALTVSWADGGGPWHGPAAIGASGRFPSAAQVAACRQAGLEQTDVFAVDKNGTMTVAWVAGAGAWGGPGAIGAPGRFVPGGGVAACQQVGLTQTDVFAIDKTGALTVAWVDAGGAWTGPVPISAPGTFVPGGGIAAGQQFGLTQTDVFAIDKNGALTVSWVAAGGNWNGPITISPTGTYLPGSPVVTSQQFGLTQTDIFAVDKHGTLTVCWVSGGGVWKGPSRIGPAGLCLPGAPPSVCQQAGLPQTDVFVVNAKGGLGVFWVDNAGSWGGPVNP